MALSTPQIYLGVHSITPYCRKATQIIGSTTFKRGQPFGIFKVLGDASFNLAASSATLFGGSNPFPWANEILQISSEFTMNIKEAPNMLYALYAGATITETAAAALGTSVGLVASTGTTIGGSSVGVDTATIKSGSESDLKFGTYIVVYVSATTVDVYAATDLQAENLTALTIQDDLLKITASALTIATSTAVTVPNTGIELTGGSGTIAIVAGDVGIYKAIPAHGGIDTIDIGKSGTVFPEHGLLVYGRERSSGRLLEIDIYKAQVSTGLNIPLLEGDYQTSDITVIALQDSAPIDGSGVSIVKSALSKLPIMPLTINKLIKNYFTILMVRVLF